MTVPHRVSGRSVYAPHLSRAEFPRVVARLVAASDGALVTADKLVVENAPPTRRAPR